MPLTEYESRQLREIEHHLRESDPSKKIGIAAAAMDLTATPLLVSGVALHILLLSVVGWMCIVGWIVLRCVDSS